MVVVAEESFLGDAIDHTMSPFARHGVSMPPAVNRKTIVVVSGLANIHARVLEPLDDSPTPRSVLFSQKATASQLYNAVSHLYAGYSCPNSFNLVLMYNDKKYPLKFENQPIPNLDLQPSQEVYSANIGVNRNSEIINGDIPKAEEDASHKPQVDSSSIKSCINKPTQSYLMEVVPQDCPPLHARSFLVSPSTTLQELYTNIIFFRASQPSEGIIRIFYLADLYQKYTSNVYNTTELFKSVGLFQGTLEEIGFDFNRPNQILALWTLDNSSDSTPVPVLPRKLANDLFIRQEESSPSSPPKFESSVQKREIIFNDLLSAMKVEDGMRTERQDSEAEAKPEMVYVGLVNQAMTCYLNSLLQALYMTPEFRNALYNWEFVGSEKDKAGNSIPYQLQKLFLNLQTSTKAAVETTSLTKSFGWDSTEAWQQHDIQELCRVMFDALEQKFKNTQQADLINRLYEGKMIDYVKCLECSTEKSREDTFLDIPLPVKPFGSNVAYNSVEEALRAFVQPETLDGTNQYFCETCNKKCDAHKGLKFSRFPYLLTLHLKRFDFDNNTFHRIKLNDRVSFPDVLNLNSFIPSDNQESPTAEEDAGVGVKCDDSSTTDSGGLDECSLNTNGINENGITSEATSDHLNNHEQDDDEGIDMSNGPSTSSTEHSQEDTRHRSASGPYVYELFSIMIHSGSASGGHYYAYIKDFRTNEWLCFNDQNVSPITDDDIQKTYGGGPTRGYYSGAYSSSTNAYMLMYRQIDPERNCLPMEVNCFPKHIQELLVKMKEHEEERKNYERSSQMYRIRVHVHHPVEKTIKSRRLFSAYDETLADLMERAWKTLDLGNVVDLDQCRLVTYDVMSDTIDSSFDDQDEETLGILLQQSSPDMLLEIRKKDEAFEKYEPGGLGTKVFHIDCVNKEILDGPIYVRGFRTQTLIEYKRQVGKILKINPERMVVALQNYPSGVRIIMNNNNKLINEGFTSGNLVFVMAKLDNNLVEIVEKFETIICLDVELPDTSKEVLEELGIQSLESRQRELKEMKELKEQKEAEKLDNQKKKADVGEGSHQNDESRDQASNWCPEASACDNEEWQEQSNSEDSSLSDSDRTLVENASEDGEINVITFDSEWYPHSKPINKEDNWEMDQEEETDYFFKATPYDKDGQKHLRVVVDKRIKFNTFKKHLEPFVGVPEENFKILRQAIDPADVDCTRLTTSLRIWEDGEKLSIKLGRALRSHEFRVKVFLLELGNYNKPSQLLFESTISKDATVEAVKRQLLAELQRKHDQSIPFEKCRLRKKHFQIPSKVLLNDQKIRDVGFQTQCEVFIQELWEEEPVTSNSQIVVMVTRVFTNEKVLGPIQEIVLEDNCYEELAKKMVELSGIELENLQVTKGKWPCNLSESRVYWTPANKPAWHVGTIEDGASIFYRDAAEKWTSNTQEEMSTAENEADKARGKISRGSRQRALVRVYNYAESPRREKALKIYLDDK
ncbi:ubiquitin carboxyl-terminal hydrolase 47 [Diachasma alloeum]|uniref:ubiquitin carboxyl-terminal hydrolase 47 n=1 Tax=Diachasma alloeum TaxID=454923 RepID=UPI00073849DE|nr:ubiquitin carboxyl-terminal hydrolase 47 [Diachasma alloeum]